MVNEKKVRIPRDRKSLVLPNYLEDLNMRLRLCRHV